MYKILAILVTASIVATSLRADEPVYEGKTVKQWIKALEDEDAEKRLAAITALAKIGPKAEEAIDPLIKRFADKEGGLRYEASAAVGKIGPKAIPPLLKTLVSTDAQVRLWSAFALGEMRAGAKEAIPALLKALEDKEATVRAEVLSALGGMGPVAKEALPRVTASLKDAEKRVRRTAAAALWHIDAQIDVPLPILIEGFKDKEADSLDRQACILVIATMQSKAQSAVPELIEALGDKKEEVHIAASYALSEIGRAAVPSLRKALTHKSSQVRRMATHTLGEMAAKEALPDLISILRAGTADKEEIFAATGALKKFGELAVPDLLRLLDDKDAKARVLGITVLGIIGPKAKAAVPALVKALEDKDAQVREVAADALKMIDADAAAKAGVK